MNTAQNTLAAIIISALTVIDAQHAQATDYSGSEFLRLGKAEQDSFFQVSMTMAAALLAQTSRKEMGSCIDRWYFATPDLIARRNDELRETVRRNAQYHPSAILISLIKKECGAYP